MESLSPTSEKKNSRKNKAIVSENAPLILKTQETDFNGASFSGAVFNLATTIIGAGIMGLPACVKKLGMVPGLIAIILTALLTEKSIEFIIRFSKAGNIASYGSLMKDAFGKSGKALSEICIVVNNIGVLIIYMIIIGIKNIFLCLVLFNLCLLTFIVVIGCFWVISRAMDQSSL